MPILFEGEDFEKLHRFSGEGCLEARLLSLDEDGNVVFVRGETRKETDTVVSFLFPWESIRLLLDASDGNGVFFCVLVNGEIVEVEEVPVASSMAFGVEESEEVFRQAVEAAERNVVEREVRRDEESLLAVRLALDAYKKRKETEDASG